MGAVKLPSIMWVEPTASQLRRAQRAMSAFRKSPRLIATCDLCGEAIMSSESYHATGCSIVHLRCEWARATPRAIWPGRRGGTRGDAMVDVSPFDSGQ